VIKLKDLGPNDRVVKLLLAKGGQVAYELADAHR